ncbi:MAG TPA: 4-(cytidine 5'-diphospho)-2-C-methyl-D-erythritol kinase [Syntrophomonas sp.]|jgi:4-diphosphocytidyl-2-C-methyl-D-erythritol kinase|nr:4-(cytidine 5'-diphospho)-2-C-methyl-D-erythritol kinase [Syntrophomonas sp.]
MGDNMETLIIEAPAKVNLTLDVKYKREDGYHELESVMHQINLIDRITIREGPKGTINLRSNHPALPNDQGNLAYKAAHLLLTEYGHGEGVDISIEKNIPLGAGLAGGSTDAAAVLWGMDQIFGYKLELAVLMKAATKLGSDISFCLLGRHYWPDADQACPGLPGATAIARGRGEVLEEMPNRYLPWILLVKPDYQVSTARVYQGLRLDEIRQRPDTPAFLAAWQDCDMMNIAKNLVNVLESVSIGIYPEIASIKADMIKYGALNALMSGSGPTVFGIFGEEKAADQARKRFLEHYKEVFLVSSYGRGEKSAGTKIATG